MDTTPNEIDRYMMREDVGATREFQGNGRHGMQKIYEDDDNAGRRIKYFSSSGEMLVNSLVLTKDPSSHIPPPCEWGYLNMKMLRIGELSPEEIRNINNSGTMQIHSITFDRFKELIQLLSR